MDYIRLDDPDNTGTLGGELSRAIARHGAARAIVTFPGEWRVWKQMRQWQQDFAVPVEVKEDDRFFCPIARFRSWADGRKQLRMEFFYREMRRDHKILLTPEGQPEGGQWNFDSENRKSLPKGLKIPPPYREEPDAITAEVLSLDERRADPELGEDFDQACAAEDEAQQAPFIFIEVFAQDPDEAELDEDLDPDIQGLPLDGVREVAALALAHLATLTARVSRITVTLTCPG